MRGFVGPCDIASQFPMSRCAKINRNAMQLVPMLMIDTVTEMHGVDQNRAGGRVHQRFASTDRRVICRDSWSWTAPCATRGQW